MSLRRVDRKENLIVSEEGSGSLLLDYSAKQKAQGISSSCPRRTPSNDLLMMMLVNAVRRVISQVLASCAEVP